MTPAEVTRYETHVHDDASALAAEVRRLQAQVAAVTAEREHGVTIRRQIEATLRLADSAMEQIKTERDAQVREAFMAGYRGSVGLVGFDLDPEAEREYAAWLATRARVSGDTREEQ